MAPLHVQLGSFSVGDRAGTWEFPVRATRMEHGRYGMHEFDAGSQRWLYERCRDVDIAGVQPVLPFIVDLRLC